MFKTSIILFISILFFLNPAKVNAEKELIYDELIGGKQEFIVETEDEPVLLAIERLDNFSHTNNFSIQGIVVRNSTYEISGSGTLWRASYRIDVQNRNIIRVHSPSAHVSIGSITSRNLRRVHSTLARYSIGWNRPVIEPVIIQLGARIVNGRLYIEDSLN